MGRKQTIRNQIEQDIQLQEGQKYAKSLGPRGNHQHEVEFTDGARKLVTLPPRFRNLVWLKRGHFVIVDPTAGTVSEKVGGEIVHVLYPKDIKELKAKGEWPEEFTDKKAQDEEEEEEKRQDSDDDDDLFVNNNRHVMSETEEEESSDEEEEEG